MLQFPENFRRDENATLEQVAAMGKLDVYLFHAFCQLLDLPEWCRVHLSRRRHEVEFASFMLQIIYQLMLRALNLITTVSAEVLLKVTSEDVTAISANYISLRTRTTDYRKWPMSPAGSTGQTDDHLSLAIARIIHEDCSTGAVPSFHEEDEADDEDVDMQID